MSTSAEFTNRRHGSFMPPMALDSKSQTPLYRQISMWFQRTIHAGQLQPGQRVPSSRALAEELGISRIPVLSAYEMLIAEGYFETFVGVGTCVSRSIPDAFSPPEREGLPDQISVAVERKALRPISRRAAGMRGPAQKWLEECRGCPNLKHFPMSIWSTLMKRHVQKKSRELMGYGEPMGYWPFREALAEYLGAFRAVKCQPSQILVTTGAQQALQISALALIDPGDSVWLEEPGYPGTQQALRMAGASLVPVPIDGQGMNVEHAIRVANHARAAYVAPAHQYPLSVTMSASRRIELLTWAARNGAWIVEDDYDSEYRFSGNPIASLQGRDMDGRVIYVGTLCKVVFPTLRLGFAVIPEDLVGAFLDVRNASDTICTSVLHQMVMTDFIREGHFSRHIKRMRAAYMERHKAMVAAIRDQADGVLEVVGDRAGLYVMALLPAGIDDLELAEAAQQMGIPVRASSQCYVSPPERGGLLMGYAHTDVRDIPAKVNALKTLIHARMPKH